MNKITVGKTLNSALKNAEEFPIGSIIINSKDNSSQTPYRIVTDNGVVNLGTGSFYTFSDCNKDAYELVNRELIIKPAQ